MKLSNLFKIQIKKNTFINEIYIGNNRFVIIEVKTHQKDIIKDKVINHLLISNLGVDWFKCYHDFEAYYEFFKSTSDLGVKFIIVG